MSVVCVVAVSSWIAALGAIGALGITVQYTVSGEICSSIRNALTVVNALDVALIAGYAVCRCSAVATELADKFCGTCRRLGWFSSNRTG